VAVDHDLAPAAQAKRRAFLVHELVGLLRVADFRCNRVLRRVAANLYEELRSGVETGQTDSVGA